MEKIIIQNHYLILNGVTGNGNGVGGAWSMEYIADA
jgi:hypothetical protein